MKKLFYFIVGIAIASMTISSCGDAPGKSYLPKNPDGNKLSKMYNHSIVYDDSMHCYDLYENGSKFSETYAFTLVHRADCKKCLDVFE